MYLLPYVAFCFGLTKAVAPMPSSINVRLGEGDKRREPRKGGQREKGGALAKDGGGPGLGFAGPAKPQLPLKNPRGG